MKPQEEQDTGARNDGGPAAESAPYTDDPDAQSPEPLTLTPLRGKGGSNDQQQQPMPKKPATSNPIRAVLFFLLAIFIAACAAVGALWTSHSYRVEHAAKLQAEIEAQRPVKAVNWALDVPRLYPSLRIGFPSERNKACLAAWESLSRVPCHEKIFNRGWDNGTWLPLLSPSPMRYVPQLCYPSCKRALKEASALVSAKCTPAVTFDTTDYKGMFNVTFLERGPVEALDVLVRRNQHTCRTSKDSEYEYCLIEMTERWGIMDGMNHANLGGLSSFLRDTDKLKKDPGGLKRGTRGSGSDGGWKKSYKYNVPPRSYGPGIGDTDCGWCTLNWLENVLNGWKPGQVHSPETGAEIALPEHLRRVRQAGQRCEVDQWNSIWEKAIRRYITKGQLTRSWETSGSGDYGWTVKNGLGQGDKPLQDIQSAVQSILTKGTPDPFTPPANAVRCLERLHGHVSALPCNIYLERSELESLIRPDNRLLESYCRDECTNSITQDDEALKICRYKKMGKHEIAGPLVTAYYNAKEVRQNVCVRAGRRHSFCAPLFASLGRPQWAYEGRPAASDFEGVLEELERQPIPEAVKAAVGKNSHAAELQARRKQYPRWEEDLESGVCSPCVWEMVVGNGDIARAKQYLEGVGDLEEYLALARRFYDACVARGATWMGGLPYGGDDAVWRIQEVDGKVYRFIVDQSGGPLSGRWARAEEESGSTAYPQHRYGSIWHLRAAARMIDAEQQGMLDEFLKAEDKHREEEDAKVWERFDKWSSWYWIEKVERQ